MAGRHSRLQTISRGEISNDYVRCFHCGGGLCLWEPDGEPWTQHARYNDSCGFLRLMKGDDFIQEVLRQYKSEPEEGKLRTFSDEEVERIMEGSIYKAAVQRGVAREEVKRVLQQQLETTGRPFYDVNSVLDKTADHTQATFQPPTSSSADGSSGQSQAGAASTSSAAPTMTGHSGTEGTRSRDENVDVQNEPLPTKGSELTRNCESFPPTSSGGSSSGINSAAETGKLLSDSPQRDGNGAAGDEQWRGAQQEEEEEEQEQGGSQHELLVDELD